MFTLQCICNGIVYEQLEKDGPTTDVLEMFFSGMSSIAGLQYFPNLQVSPLPCFKERGTFSSFLTPLKASK